MAAGRETDEQLTEYEKQRLTRIRENEARLETLGLCSLAASPLLRSPSPGTAKGKQKRRSADEEIAAAARRRTRARRRARKTKRWMEREISF